MEGSQPREAVRCISIHAARIADTSELITMMGTARRTFTSRIQVSESLEVLAGRYLGDQGVVLGCGGLGDQPCAAHVHFSLWYTPYGTTFSLGNLSQEVDLNNVQLSDWVVYRGTAQYAGCMAPLLGGALQCASSGAIVNDGRVGGSMPALHDGRTLSGYAAYPTRSVETDDLDLYLREPNLVVNEEYQQMPGVEGLVIARSEISTIAVIDPSLSRIVLFGGYVGVDEKTNRPVVLGDTWSWDGSEWHQLAGPVYPASPPGVRI
jgi:hypothetical protein